MTLKFSYGELLEFVGQRYEENISSRPRSVSFFDHLARRARAAAARAVTAEILAVFALIESSYFTGACTHRRSAFGQDEIELARGFQ